MSSEEIPYGYCKCGCGQKTNTRPENSKIKKSLWGVPYDYITGHNRRKGYKPPNPSGYCMCGCGRKTTLAKFSVRENGLIKGEHVRYIAGHQSVNHPARTTDKEVRQYKDQWLVDAPDISYGYCQCGCGNKTPIAPQTNREYKQIVGEPMRYLSSHGRKLAPRYLEEDRGYETFCWIWQRAINGHGYGQSRNGKGKSVLAHRRMFEEEYGFLPNKPLHHLCQVKSCVRPDHLIAMDAIEHTSLHASLHPKEDDGRRWIPKLTQKKADEIRHLKIKGYTYSQLAQLYNVSYTSVAQVVRNEIW